MSQNFQFLSDKEIDIIKSSWENLGEDRHKIPEEHYKYLFKNHPELKELFASDPLLQNMRFIHSMDIVIAGLERTEEVIHYYKTLGFRHKGFKVKKKHYPTIVKSILHAIEIVQGERYTPEVNLAWNTMMIKIGEIMVMGAKAQYLPKLKKKK